VLAIESSTDDSRYTGVRAVQVGNKTHVTIAFTADSIAEVWRLVQAEVDRDQTLRLAIIPALRGALPPSV
jgi:hypothetical protein